MEHIKTARLSGVKPKSQLLLKRLCLVGLGLSLSALYFFVIGNFLVFTDESQMILLTIMGISALGTMAEGLLGLGFILFSPLVRTSGLKRGLGVFGYCLAVVLCGIIALLSGFLRSFTQQ